MQAIVPNNQIVNDNALLERVTHGEVSALSELYDRHSTLLYSIIMRIIKDRAVAEDILCEVFLKVWDHTETYDGMYGNVGAWLARVARNYAVQRLRSMKQKRGATKDDGEEYREYFAADASTRPEHHAILSSQQEEILIALTSLSKEQKTLFEFSYFRGFTQSELAEHFKIPLATVKSRLRSAMSALRQKLRHHLA